MTVTTWVTVTAAQVADPEAKVVERLEPVEDEELEEAGEVDDTAVVDTAVVDAGKDAANTTS